VKVTHAVLVLMPSKSKWEQCLFEDLGVYSQSFRCSFSSSRFGYNSDDASHISILLHGQVFVRHGMAVHPLLVLMMSKWNSHQSLFEDFGVHLQMFKCLFWSHFGHNSHNKSNIQILPHGKVFVIHGTFAHAWPILILSKSCWDQCLFEDCGVHSQTVECWFWSHCGIIWMADLI